MLALMAFASLWFAFVSFTFGFLSFCLFHIYIYKKPPRREAWVIVVFIHLSFPVVIYILTLVG